MVEEGSHSCFPLERGRPSVSGPLFLLPRQSKAHPPDGPGNAGRRNQHHRRRERRAAQTVPVAAGGSGEFRRFAGWPEGGVFPQRRFVHRRYGWQTCTASPNQDQGAGDYATVLSRQQKARLPPGRPNHRAGSIDRTDLAGDQRGRFDHRFLSVVPRWANVRISYEESFQTIGSRQFFGTICGHKKYFPDRGRRRSNRVWNLHCPLRRRQAAAD